MGALNGLTSIARKELLHILRDPTTLIFALLIPMVQLTLFGFAIDYDIRHVATAVVDLDHSRESRQYVESLRNTGYLDVVSYPDSPTSAEESLRNGSARVAILIPPDFARRSVTGSPPTVRVLLDGSDSQVANPARSAFIRPMVPPARTETTVNGSTPLPGTPLPDPPTSGAVDVRFDVLFNPQMHTQIYTIPGLLGVILQLVIVSLTSFSLVREREQGTLDQLMVSPVRRVGLMLGKLVPYAVLAMGELFLVLFVAGLVFNVHSAGSLALLLTLSAPFILAALSIGLLISTIAQNQAQALQMTLLTVLPSILLSGYIAPRETLPAPLYVLSGVLPVTYFIQIVRGIMVRGAGLADVMPSVVALLVLTLLLLTAAMIRFRKSAA